MIFKLEGKEELDANNWIKEHNQSCPKREQVIKGFYSYTFMPTGIGDVKKITCDLCKQFKNVTDVNNW